MKCVNCGTDNSVKVEEGETVNISNCKKCNHPFVFTFQPGSQFSDTFFYRTCQRISKDNTLFFTPKQLGYFLEKRLTTFNGKPFEYYAEYSNRIAITFVGLLIIIGSAILSLTLNASNEVKYVLFLIGTGSGLFLVYSGKKPINESSGTSKRFKIAKPEAVNNWLKRWTDINGSVEKMLLSPEEESSNIEVNYDISADDLNKLIVCETPEIAHFLIANKIPLEHHCTVLSITGYPQTIFNAVIETLRDNPDLKVYALHNASPRGVALVDRLQTSSNWFANSEIVIYDLGLSPRHVLSGKSIFVLNSYPSETQAQQISAPVRENLSADEIAWLEAGNYVELESFNPERLLQVVSRGIANSPSVLGDENWNDDEENKTAARDFKSLISDYN